MKSSSFQDIAHALGFEAMADTINLPRNTGKGSIQKVQVGKGLQVTVWNALLNNPLELVRPATLPESNPIFTLTYIFTPDHFLFQDTTAEKGTKLKEDAYFLFDTGKQDTRFTILPGINTRSLVISIETKWLQEEFNNSVTLISERLQQLIFDDKPVLYYQPVSPEDYKSAADLFHHFITEQRDLYYIKGSILVLLSHFFQRFFYKTSEETEGSNIAHYEKMKTVERILSESINSNLPSVNSIARKVVLSESSLKRYFKLMYGTSVYEYYLQKKMEYAKIQLIEKGLPVKEVAYMLGYENSGSFIRIFKKHYQLAPGLLQKENRRAGRKANE